MHGREKKRKRKEEERRDGEKKREQRKKMSRKQGRVDGEGDGGRHTSKIRLEAASGDILKASVMEVTDERGR